MPFFFDFLYPELRGVSAEERRRRLREARQVPLEAIELFGMAAGLVVVTALTRYAGAELDASSRFAAALVNFAIAVPLLALCLGPFHVRRVRRGLRRNQENDGKAQPDIHADERPDY